MDRAVFLSLILCLVGCQATQVRNQSDTLTSTVPDLYYQMILNNLAMTVRNPDAFPYFGIPTQGTATDQRLASLNYTPGLDFITGASAFVGRWVFDHQTTALTGTYTWTDAVQVTPLSDPDKIGLIQLAFQVAAGLSPDESALALFYSSKGASGGAPTPGAISGFWGPRPGSEWTAQQPNADLAITSHDTALASFEAVNTPPPATITDTPGAPTATGASAAAPTMQQFFRYFDWINRPRWFNQVSRKRDVPKDACYVGHCGDVWIWVAPEHYRDLRDFTLAILDIATTDQNRLLKPQINPQVARAALDKYISLKKKKEETAKGITNLEQERDKFQMGSAEFSNKSTEINKAKADERDLDLEAERQFNLFLQLVTPQQLMSPRMQFSPVPTAPATPIAP